MRLVAFALVLSVPGLAAAQNVTVEFTPGADAQAAADFIGSGLDEFESLLEAEASDALGVLNSEQYLQPFADAQAFSSNGLTVDYASEFGTFLVGFGVSSSFGVSGDINPDNVDRAVDGVAPGASVLLGLDIGDLRIFGSGFRRSGGFGDVDEFDLTVDNLALHGQYRLFGDDETTASDYIWYWRGIDLTAGVRRSRTSLTLSEELPSSLPLSSDGGELEVDLASTGSLELEASSVTIPLEVTTAITLLSVATVYGGVGIDIQTGDATLRAELAGDLTADNPEGGNAFDVGTLSVRADESANASPGRLRTMVGVQANLWVFKAFVQLNSMPGVAASVAGGLRLAI
ncbi:MAG: hypothetical protein AAFQ82_13185 [Myxococcota bacterium]